MMIYNEIYNESCYRKKDKINFNSLSSTLTTLYLPDKFNENLEKNLFPKSLQVLIFGNSFNQKIYKNILPTNLKVLIF